MFSHVMLGVNDLEVSKKFYDALLGTLGIGPGMANKNRYFYRSHRHVRHHHANQWRSGLPRQRQHHRLYRAVRRAR